MREGVMGTHHVASGALTSHQRVSMAMSPRTGEFPGTIREDLPIEIVPTVGTTPTKIILALLTWAEQIRIGLHLNPLCGKLRIMAQRKLTSVYC